MRILNPYYKKQEPAELSSLQPTEHSKQMTNQLDSEEIKMEIAAEKPKISKVQIEIVAKPLKSSKSKASPKAFDHLHSQTLIDKTRDLKRRLHPMSREIPQEFLNLQKCLALGSTCEREISLILSK